MAKKQKEQTQEAQKLLAKVPNEYVFWCCDGRVLRDMGELAEALAVMTDETFGFHSNKAKKDFSNWLADIIGDKKLAKELESVLNRNQAAKIVAKRVDALKK
jgi:hypothetical protein